MKLGEWQTWSLWYLGVGGANTFFIYSLNDIDNFLKGQNNKFQ
jgi:hypothetical protein